MSLFSNIYFMRRIISLKFSGRVSIIKQIKSLQNAKGIVRIKVRKLMQLKHTDTHTEAKRVWERDVERVKKDWWVQEKKFLFHWLFM